MKLLVITVNYCCAEEILDGLDETLQQILALGEGEFWIVDNKSPDNSVEVLQREILGKPYAKSVKILLSDHNGGFGYGNNVAIRAALSLNEPPQYLYFLNPDATPRPNALRSMISFLDDHKEVGVVGGALCDEDGKVQTSMFRFPSFRSEIDTAIQLGLVSRLFRDHRVPLDTPTAPTLVDWVSGASFMVRREAFEDAGLFDETFFLYWEEVELCHRIKKAGYQIYGLPDVVVSHVGGVTTGFHNPEKRTSPYWYASRIYFFQITEQVKHVRLLNFIVALCLIIRRAKQFILGRPMCPPYFLRDFIKFSVASSKKG